jgi:hypothetical protein
MKTKALILICLFSGIMMNEVSAQKTRTYSSVIPIEGNSYIISVICEGTEVDKLAFPETYDLKQRAHYNDDQLVWAKGFVMNALYTSLLTGEVFKTKDIEFINSDGMLIWHMNLIGNMGNHYNIRMVYDVATWTLLGYNSTCH